MKVVIISLCSVVQSATHVEVGDKYGKVVPHQNDKINAMEKKNLCGDMLKRGIQQRNYTIIEPFK